MVLWRLACYGGWNVHFAIIVANPFVKQAFPHVCTYTDMYVYMLATAVAIRQKAQAQKC